MRLLAFLFIALLFTINTAPAGLCVVDEASSFTKVELPVNGVTRTFYYHLPRTYTGSPTPLVFLYHGGGGDAIPFASDIRLSERADQNNFIAVAPQGYDHKWNYGVDQRNRSTQNDIDFTRLMMSYIESRYAVDQARIYMGGFSEGAWFTQWATYHIPNKIAAAAAVCALEPVQWEMDYGRKHAHLPIAFMFGTADPRMHWNGGITPNGTSIISANGTVWSWIRSNGCVESAYAEELPNRSDTDGSRVELTYYRERAGNDVAYYKIIGGGHAWPGASRTTSANGNVNEDMDATQKIWEFFKEHPKRILNYPGPVPRF